MWGHRLDRSGAGQGQVAGTCECGNETSGSIKCREFLNQQRTGYPLKKDSAAVTKIVSAAEVLTYTVPTVKVITGEVMLSLCLLNLTPSRNTCKDSLSATNYCSGRYIECTASPSGRFTPRKDPAVSLWAADPISELQRTKNVCRGCKS